MVDFIPEGLDPSRDLKKIILINGNISMDSKFNLLWYWIIDTVSQQKPCSYELLSHIRLSGKSPANWGLKRDNCDSVSIHKWLSGKGELPTLHELLAWLILFSFRVYNMPPIPDPPAHNHYIFNEERVRRVNHYLEILYIFIDICYTSCCDNPQKTLKYLFDNIDQRIFCQEIWAPKYPFLHDRSKSGSRRRGEIKMGWGRPEWMLPRWLHLEHPRKRGIGIMMLSNYINPYNRSFYREMLCDCLHEHTAISLSGMEEIQTDATMSTLISKRLDYFVKTRRFQRRFQNPMVKLVLMQRKAERAARLENIKMYDLGNWTDADEKLLSHHRTYAVHYYAELDEKKAARTKKMAMAATGAGAEDDEYKKEREKKRRLKKKALKQFFKKNE